jgi:hypothetical protein
MFPYLWTQECFDKEQRIERDSRSGYCITENGKRLFARRGEPRYAAFLLGKYCAVEMDVRSPHRYVTHENHMFATLDIPPSDGESGFFVKEGDVVADVGCAVGNFALSVADIASHIYLFECDTAWIEALELTFRPYADKVTIVNKYVGDGDTEKTVTLDTFFKDKQVNFIKADIEGAEMEMLRGARALLTDRNDIKLSVCTYHKEEDAGEIQGFFEELGYRAAFTKGYVLEGGSLRKAIIRAEKVL